MGKLKSSFVLKKYQKGEKLVELHLNFGYKEYNTIKDKFYYKPLRYYTGIKVKNHEWDKQNKVPLNQKKLTELLNLEQTAHDIFNYLLKNNTVITPELFRSELDSAIKGKTVVKSVIIIEQYIREVILVNNNNRTEGTLRNYSKLASKLKEFQAQNGIALTVNNLNEETFLAFVQYVRTTVNRINSVWDVIKILKAVLSEIRRKYKIPVFNPASDIANGDKVSQHTEDKIYFTFESLQKLMDYTPDSERLKNTKRILLTLLFTGCRFSDVFKIRPEYNYNEDGVTFRYARFIDQKTGKDIIIPILKPLEDMYKKTDQKLPNEISGVNFNIYAKELCKLAKLTDEVKLPYTDSYGKTQYESKPFFKFVSSHIGRRSFITNLINFIPVTILTKITGHTIRDKSIIFKYNKISLLDNAILFVKELKRITESNPQEFPIRLV